MTSLPSFISNNSKIKKHIKCILWLIIISGISTIISILLNSVGIVKENTLMVFLVGILAISILTKGFFYGFIGSVINLLTFNYFFAEPLNTFIISNAQDLILIIFFMLASMICGTVSSKLQHQTEIAKQNERAAQLLYNISESFLNLTGISNIVMNGLNYIYKYTGYPCCAILDDSKFNIDETQYSTHNYIVNDNHSDALYTMPIKGLTLQIGSITFSNITLPLPEKNDMIIKTVVYQMALVLDRELINNEREQIKIAMESERLKSTLLRSISHDIRTPLTGIMGASGLILDSLESLSNDSIKKLVSDINEESAWLINSVQNILDMTRISEGHLTMKKEYEAVDDLINEAITHVPWLTTTNRFKAIIPDEIILVETDGRLIVQVLVNLLNNAYKHSGNDSIIELRAFHENNYVVFEVSDNGLGIDEAIKETLFDSFTTLPRNNGDGSRGVGLGLSICKAIVDAHSGRITASNKPTNGAVFRVELPLEENNERKKLV